ncbi:hypothetical protein FRB99_004831 [Tulasnella sp. 403]|nr:hypothetical protein FRB99_004831 [Tulasnella sp. 403]
MKLSLAPLLALASLVPISIAMGPSYFHITRPAAGDQWTQGQAHAANWVHAVDNIDIVDVELARMSTSGLLLAAREVPTRWGSLNLLLGDVPPGDDYYLVFLNVTHGVVYSVSQKFTILPPDGTSANSTTQVAADPSKPTVTVTGAPGPLMSFAATYGPQAAGAASLWSGLADGRTTLMLVSGVMAAFLGGVALVL